ncbi:uncharacterized protein JCM6883_006400 [Sporobolomyces salmoneus]|uniref:uncharacterized protein n=1 Tax=Sporobolomyces salmoneus TaxID=183962 RepID=UPI0031797205
MPSAPATTEKPSGGLASLGLSSLEDVLLKSVISSTIGPQPTVQSGKEPLSLQATSVNFRRFVQKSGPVFVAQDAAEAVFRWEDPPKTVFFALCWAFIFLVAVLLTTHNARKEGCQMLRGWDEMGCDEEDGAVQEDGSTYLHLDRIVAPMVIPSCRVVTP